MAPSGRGQYATDSLRTAALRHIVPHFEHRLFLSATPHNGYPESFTALLELLDNQRFARGVTPDRDQLAAIMVRRLKSELPPRWDGTPRFPKRTLEALEVPYTPEERGVHGLLQRYSRLRQQGPADEVERYATDFVLKLLKKRLFSSPAAFAGTLAKHMDSLQNARRRDHGAQRAGSGGALAGGLARARAAPLLSAGRDRAWPAFVPRDQLEFIFAPRAAERAGAPAGLPGPAAGMRLAGLATAPPLNDTRRQET